MHKRIKQLECHQEKRKTEAFVQHTFSSVRMFAIMSLNILRDDNGQNTSKVCKMMILVWYLN